MRTFRLAPTPFALAAFLLASSAAHAQTTPADSAAQTMPTVLVNACADASVEGLSKAYAAARWRAAGAWACWAMWT